MQEVYFPHLPLREAIPRYVEYSRKEGRNAAMRAFRAWVRGYLGGGDFDSPKQNR